MDLVTRLLDDESIRRAPSARELVPIMCRPVGRSSAGYPYLEESAWVRLRDWVPHSLGCGPVALAGAQLVLRVARALQVSADELANLEAAEEVVRQVVATAAVTAPPDLWLLRHVIAACAVTGLSGRLLAGEVIAPTDTEGLRGEKLRGEELRTDLSLLLSRGLLLRASGGLRLADRENAARSFEDLGALDADVPAALTPLWVDALAGSASADVRALLLRVAAGAPSTTERVPGHWSPSPEEIEVGYRLVPLVLALRASGRTPEVLEADNAAVLFADDAELSGAAASVLRAAGALDDNDALTTPGRRVLERGPGPFGIIEAYHAYMQQLPVILAKGRGAVWVERRANVDASQAANAKSFARANDALDRFSAETGFTYDVFIEHAIGRGEATRQRFERSGESLRYVGADLEDAAIDAAIEERDAGHLPATMAFVRNADIGLPARLLDGLAEAGVAPEGAVMLVGNGFHEVRAQTDERMTAIFAEYERAGLLVLFTEETALAIEDLLATAWNTYHAGFKYVHERSGQGLRPAISRPPSALEGALPLSWTECAERGGYVRADAWSGRSRTVYPYTPVSGHNPAISVNHFFVPARIAKKLGILHP